MEGKEFYEKTEKFAKKIISLAAEEGLTVRELCKAADTAVEIAEKDSLVKKRGFYCGETEEMQDCGNSPA